MSSLAAVSLTYFLRYLMADSALTLARRTVKIRQKGWVFTSKVSSSIQSDISIFYNIPAFQASPTCGFAVFRTHEANAMQTRHMSDCFRGRRGASNPLKKTEDYSKQRRLVAMLVNATVVCVTLEQNEGAMFWIEGYFCDDNNSYVSFYNENTTFNDKLQFPYGDE